MKRLSLLVLSLMVIAGCEHETVQPTPPPPAPLVLPQTMDEAIASGYRTPENTKRDPYRHPSETLQFFGLLPSMTVVEVSPGAGWYMEILAPYLNQKGQYVGAWPPSGDGQLNAAVTTWFNAHPDISQKVSKITFNPADPMGNLGPDNSADMVLTFRNVHNWMMSNNAQQAFNQFFKVLKPGGVLGVVDHRADPKKPNKHDGKTGYVLESDILKFAKKAGFKLEAQSEINANPKDTKDYPSGVWSLPPSLKQGAQDREKFLAIGESDRMTLKFVKPMKAHGKKKKH